MDISLIGDHGTSAQVHVRDSGKEIGPVHPPNLVENLVKEVECRLAIAV
jgi:hypothetical protein